MSISIDELSKLAIAEVEKELSSDIGLRIPDEEISFSEIKEEEPEINLEKSEISAFERKYLKNIKERILVLFEALNAEQDEEDLRKRLELTISFIEFLLANIEERLKN